MTRLAVLVSAVAALIATRAFAADIPPNPPATTPAYSWTGFYGGLNGGYDLGANNNAGIDGCADPVGTGLCRYVAAGGFSPIQLTPKGFMGGGQVGYNWQIANLVWGLEADFQGSGIEASGTQTTEPPGFVAGAETLQERLPWFGTVRGRLGVAVNKTWLLYATGGLIYGDVSSSATGTNLRSGLTGSGSNSSVQDGWTLGSGVEVALGGRWTTRLEYLYFDLGRESVTAIHTTGPVGDSVTISQAMAGQIIRAGLNYRF
jgi:outer membrane immunogenic protein